MDELSKDILGCGDILEDKANRLLEQAGDLIPEDPEQITISQYEHLLSDNVIQEMLQENRVGFKLLLDFKLVTLHCLESLKNVVLVVMLIRCCAHIRELLELVWVTNPSVG